MKITATETYTEYDTGKAVVRIHPGKLSEEERRVVIEKAAQRYLKAMYAAKTGA